MSFKQQYFEWDIPEDQVLYGQPVGFEIQFSQDPSFTKILSRFSTFDEVGAIPIGVLSYTLDDGENWTDFPIDETGVIFNQPYKLRLLVSNCEGNAIYAHMSSKTYKMSSRLENTIETLDVDPVYSSNIFDINTIKNSLCLNKNDPTLYRISTKDELSFYNNSININGNPIGIEIDEIRNSFWQIQRDKVYLKDWNGEQIFSVNIPSFDNQEIDVDWSSSSSSYSSSSSTSLSSSSSTSLSSTSSTSSSLSTESVGNTSSSSESSISSSSSTESEGNTSSSTSTSTSMSSLTSTSLSSSTSSSSDQILDLNYAGFGIETRDVSPAPTYNFDMAYMVFVANGATRFNLLNSGVDSNLDVARRIKVAIGGKITITLGNSNDFAAQTFKIYKNNSLVKTIINVYYGDYSTYTFTELQINDTIDVRIENANGLDIYNYQIHPDLRIRFKLRGYL